MEYASKDILDTFNEFDAPTLFNAVIEIQGATQGGTELEGMGGMPENYTGPQTKCLLPEFGQAVGYAITCEVSTSDPNTVPIPWEGYYSAMEKTPGPMIAVVKDIDPRAGRGACFGDGMAAFHKALGVVGVIIDGSVRDLIGIKQVGLPIWGSGLVPGHGVFNLLSVNHQVTVDHLSINPGELLIADINGCVKIPSELDPGAILQKAQEIRDRENKMIDFATQTDFRYEKLEEFLKK